MTAIKLQAIPLYDLPSDLDEVGQDLKYDAHWNLKVCLTSSLPASDLATWHQQQTRPRIVYHTFEPHSGALGVHGLMTEELSRLVQSHSAPCLGAAGNADLA